MADTEPGTSHAVPLNVWVKVEPCDSDEQSPASPALSETSNVLHIKIEPETELTEAYPTVEREVQNCVKEKTDKASKCTPEFRCGICDRTFKAKHSFTYHTNRCKERPNLTCQFCNKTYTEERKLKSHLICHKTDSPYQCNVCHMKFKYKTSLRPHLILHSDVKPYACPYCGKGYTSKCLMKSHIRTHTKEKPFQCPICLKCFGHKANMLRHSINHNKVKHLICDVCHKAFPKESRLKYHMRVHWPENRPFKCQECPRKYSDKMNIERHYKKKHPNVQYTAPDTDAGLATKAWEAFLKMKQDTKGYILPELEPNPEQLHSFPDIKHCAIGDINSSDNKCDSDNSE